MSGIPQTRSHHQLLPVRSAALPSRVAGERIKRLIPISRWNVIAQCAAHFRIWTWHEKDHRSSWGDCYPLTGDANIERIDGRHFVVLYKQEEKDHFDLLTIDLVERTKCRFKHRGRKYKPQGRPGFRFWDAQSAIWCKGRELTWWRYCDDQGKKMKDHKTIHNLAKGVTAKLYPLGHSRLALIEKSGAKRQFSLLFYPAGDDKVEKVSLNGQIDVHEELTAVWPVKSSIKHSGFAVCIRVSDKLQLWTGTSKIENASRFYDETAMSCSKEVAVSRDADVTHSKDNILVIDEQTATLFDPCTLTMRHRIPNFSPSCLLPGRGLVLAYESPAKSQAAGISIWHSLETEGFERTVDSPIVIRGLEELPRRKGKIYQIDDQVLISWVLEVLKAPESGPSQPIEDCSLAYEEHESKAGEIQGHIHDLFLGKEWEDKASLREDVVAAMLYHYPWETQLYFYVSFAQNPERINLPLVEYLFLHTKDIMHFGLPYTLARIASQRGASEREQFEGVIRKALKAAGPRYVGNAKESDRQRVILRHGQIVESAARNRVIDAKVRAHYLFDRTDCQIKTHPALAQLAARIDSLEEAVKINRTNIGKITTTLKAMIKTQDDQRKRALFFGVAKTALAFFGGQALDLIEKVIDLSDLAELAHSVLNLDPDKVRPVLEAIAEHVREAVEDRIEGAIADHFLGDNVDSEQVLSDIKTLSHTETND